MRFYGQNIDTPLSLAHNTGQWQQSIIGQLHAQTNGAVFIREVKKDQIDTARFVWRVVDAYWSTEDNMMTAFRAYDRGGIALPYAQFGVNWKDAPRITGGFKYPPFSQQMCIPKDNQFMTNAGGGYTVQVLDFDNPSEGLAFGIFKQGQAHNALVISFRLFEVGVGYPNDLGLMIR